MTLVEKQLPGEDYLVLSHCWGRPTEEEKKRFCTTRQNYQDRLQGFSCDELPRTFQDAVRVARLLGKQYLWIDALCIIQGPEGDWNTEARSMEDIFASAYCTIAASSARGWRNGFLKPNLDFSDIEMPCIPSTPTCACNFKNDVDEGTLVRREPGHCKNRCCPGELSILRVDTCIGSVGMEYDANSSQYWNRHSGSSTSSSILTFPVASASRGISALLILSNSYLRSIQRPALLLNPIGILRFIACSSAWDMRYRQK